MMVFNRYGSETTEQVRDLFIDKRKGDIDDVKMV